MIKLPTITYEIKKLYLEDNQKPFEDLLIQFYNSSQHPIITKYFFNGTSINHDMMFISKQNLLEIYHIYWAKMKISI